MNTKYIKKRYQKLILELKYLYAELEYHEDILKDAKEEFEKALQEEGPKYGLNIPKPQQPITSSSTEVQLYTGNGEDEEEDDEEPLPDFNEPQDTITESTEEVKDEDEGDFTKLFKYIARLTHPDTCGINTSEEDKKKKLLTFMKARKAVESKNWFELCQIAIDLGVELPEPTKKHIKFLEDESIRVKNKIQFITGTYAWNWYSDEQKRDFYMRSYINVVKG
jgi:hypothetical protein